MNEIAKEKRNWKRIEESLRLIPEERGSREMKETPLFSYVLRRSPSFAAVHVEIAIHVAVGRRESAHSEMNC